MSKIKEGITTKAEVRELLGEPNSVSRRSDGSEIWTYTSDDIVMKSFINNTIWAMAGLVRSWIPEAILPPTMAKPTVGSQLNASCYSTTISFNTQGIVTSIDHGGQKF